MCASSRAATSWCARLFEHDHAYIFQNADGRIVFAIPYERDFTLIGTTDEDFTGDLAGAGRDRRRDHLSVPRRQRLFPQSGDAGSGGACLSRACASFMTTARAARKNLTREYVLDLDGARAGRRRCSPSMAARSRPTAAWPRPRSSELAPVLQARRAWTADAPLPGGDFPYDGVEALVARARGLWPFLTEPNARRHGARLRHAARSHSRRRARRRDDLGERFGDD